MDATKYPYKRKYVTNNKQFLDIFLRQDFKWHFPDF